MAAAATFDEKKVTYSQISVGTMLTFKAVMAFGIGLEYRNDQISDMVFTEHYGRPWARANVGYAIPSPILKPFVGLEVAVPLTTASSSYSNPSLERDYLRTVAPKAQLGVYGGIRF